MFNISAHKPPRRATHLRLLVLGNSGLGSSSTFPTNSNFSTPRRAGSTQDRSAVLFRKLREDLEILALEDKQQQQQNVKK